MIFLLPRRGFSILMALGIIAILFVLVGWLAALYLRELQLSRLSYDEVIASAGAEWVFEYGMLKIRNHRDGFSDTMTWGDQDGLQFGLSTSRSSALQAGYTIEAQSTGAVFELEPGNHLIIPLFVGYGEILSGKSQDPRFSTGTHYTDGLTVTGIDKISWVIVAGSGAENIGLSGSGNIGGSSTHWVIRHRDVDCYDQQGVRLTNCSPSDRVYEELVYFWDESLLVDKFLSTHTDPYLMLYNTSNDSMTITIQSRTPFALPTARIEAQARNGDALQVFEFLEDRSRYYDAIRYGIYDPSNSVD